MKYTSPAARLGVAIVALSVPIGATAATINTDLFANDIYTSGFTLSPGELQVYNFSVKENVVIDQFSVSGSGPSDADGSDLSNVTFGLINPPTDSFDSVEVEMGVSKASEFVSGATFEANDMFSFYFEDGIDTPVSLTLSFNTKSPAPIPLPAGGVLLLSALAGGTAFARRKKSRH